MVERRQVFYVEGYDPQGAEGYYGLFQLLLRRIRPIWPAQAEVGELKLDSEFLAHWDVEASGPKWRVATHYEFLRLEHIIRAEMAEPIVLQVPRAMVWALDYLITGTIVRVVRKGWPFGLHLLYFQAALLLWLALAVVGGGAAAHAVAATTGLPHLTAHATGVIVGVACLAIMRPLVDRAHVLQGNRCWSSLSRFARGRASDLDAPIEAFAQRLVAVARANEADEIVVIGHSWGGAIAPLIVASALELDPDVGRRRARLVLLTLGSIMPAAALHPDAVRLHKAIRRLAAEPSVRWLECEIYEDVLSCGFDPVQAAGIELGGRRCNPLPWQVQLRDMVHADLYGRLRWKFLRMHYQIIMANDRRAPYDYFLVACGPLPVEEWAARGRDLVAAFSPDGTDAGPALASPAAAD